MKWIGLTGGLGTGKSTVAQLIRDEGIVVLDADELAKKVMAPGSPGLKAVITKFGQEYQLPDGQLDRKKMSELVFTNPGSLLELERIIHPLVQQSVTAQRERERARGTPIMFYDVPLLFEKNIEGFDAVLVVTSRVDLQSERLKKRNGWSDEEIQRRLKNQMTIAEKEKRATLVIQNNGSMDSLRGEVKKALAFLLKL
jgi:dephospho-CoA kinase